MADLIFLGYPQSTYVRSARMACVEKGVPYTLEPAGPHSEAINAIHPFGKMPAMRHGDFTLYETAAILRYIDDVFDGPRLTPSDPKKRARMEQWISAINAYVYDAMIRRVVLAYFFAPAGGPDRAVIETGAADAKKQVALIDEALGEGPYLLGAEVSLADLLLCPILAYFFQTPEGKGIMEATRNIPRGGAAIRARKSYQETVPPPPPSRN